MLVGEEAAHAGPETEAVRGAIVECPGEAGLVPGLIPQLRAELGAVLPAAHNGLKQEEGSNKPGPTSQKSLVSIPQKVQSWTEFGQRLSVQGLL